MHTHPGRPPAGLSGRGSRCEATARAARPAAQTKQSALAVSAAQFQMPRPSRRALIGPRARGSVSTGSARPGAALAQRPAAALPRAGGGGGGVGAREREPGGGWRRGGWRSDRETRGEGRRFPSETGLRDKGRSGNSELFSDWSESRSDAEFEESEDGKPAPPSPRVDRRRDGGAQPSCAPGSQQRNGARSRGFPEPNLHILTFSFFSSYI